MVLRVKVDLPPMALVEMLTFEMEPFQGLITVKRRARVIRDGTKGQNNFRIMNASMLQVYSSWGKKSTGCVGEIQTCFDRSQELKLLDNSENHFSSSLQMSPLAFRGSSAGFNEPKLSSNKMSNNRWGLNASQNAPNNAFVFHPNWILLD